MCSWNKSYYTILEISRCCKRIYILQCSMPSIGNCYRLELMDITGKRKSKVPVLLTPDMAIYTFLRVRGKYRDEGNPFLFAVSKGKRSTTRWNALKQVVSKVKNLEDAACLTSTKLQKYLATMSKESIVTIIIITQHHDFKALLVIIQYTKAQSVSASTVRHGGLRFNCDK